MVNVIAPIFTRPDGLFLQTIYHPLRLYAEHVQAVALDAFVDAPTDDLGPEDEQAVTADDRPWRIADLGPFSLLDVTASVDTDGRELCLAVVNRDPHAAIPTRIEVAGTGLLGGARLYEVNGAEPGTRNSFEQPEAVRVQERTLEPGGAGIDVTFAPHSVTLLRGRLG
jgi:alpha-N-arabinofuranosidase